MRRMRELRGELLTTCGAKPKTLWTDDGRVIRVKQGIKLGNWEFSREIERKVGCAPIREAWASLIDFWTGAAFDN